MNIERGDKVKVHAFDNELGVVIGITEPIYEVKLIKTNEKLYLYDDEFILIK